jgi:L-alanine-DL-glutamate epimerase-like enolase superfamily enzyme
MHENGLSFRIDRISAWSLRAPLTAPVATSFGVMRDRPAVFVRIEEASGAVGWGEVFANWPVAGAEHRVHLLMDDLAHIVLGRTWESPAEMLLTLEATTRIRALQCGEPGPFRQVIAGLDIAAWDLVSTRSGVPLSAVLSDRPAARVAVYASGIHIANAAKAIESARAIGFRGFKVKVGFDSTLEPQALGDCMNLLQSTETLCADANQAWSVPEASAFLSKIAPLGLRWMEEPIAADGSLADWAELAKIGVPLAGGENVAGFADFDTQIGAGHLRYVQPDVCKWGGVSGNLAVAQQALQNGQIYCPHFLGGGIGLFASAHVLAAAGGAGALEIDVNANPLRDLVASSQAHIADGHWTLSARPGLGHGFRSLPEELESFVTLHRET